MYAFTLAPLFLVCFETACLLVSFLVALPMTAAARTGNSGIGMSTSPSRQIMSQPLGGLARTPKTGDPMRQPAGNLSLART